MSETDPSKNKVKKAKDAFLTALDEYIDARIKRAHDGRLVGAQFGQEAREARVVLDKALDNLMETM